LLARDFEDELKQVESVGKVTKVAIVEEAVISCSRTPISPATA